MKSTLWKCDDLYVRGGTPYGRYRRLQIARATPHYQLGEFTDGRLEDFDTVWMRKDPPFDMKFFFATHLAQPDRPDHNAS